ncbi:DUF2303 family protein [Bradyrhizobium sp. 2]|uniref:DUF2303 family protein n=1 Tax=Bradyrhizobium sp. 2 TaxID=190045 RepID=UPI0020985E47|nr:DUF2303 family protein [Bradyrhizobium sp. 2]MCK1459212.1 DUF2303 family protein [Bradyrhizobium sp. 2]
MSEVEAVSGLVLASQAKPVQFDAPEGRTFVALPAGEGTFKLEQITSPNKADVLMPKTVMQHVKMQTAESLAGYINRFKNADTMLFADIASDTIVSVIDYHGAIDSKADGLLSPAGLTPGDTDSSEVSGMADVDPRQWPVDEPCGVRNVS